MLVRVLLHMASGHTEVVKVAVMAPPFAVRRKDTLPPPWPGRPVHLDGTVTFLRETPPTAPDAQPALYVHGLGGSSTNWTDLADLLSHRLHGHAIDLPGFGYSDPGRRYTIAALADRVVRWIEVADQGPVHLFGNSLGGAIVTRVAAMRPDLVRTLVLISPALPFLDPRRSVQGRFVPFVFLPGAGQLARRRLALIEPAELARQVMAACFADVTRISPQRLEEAVAEARLRYDLPWYMDAYMRSLRGLVGSFVRAYLPGSGSLWRMAGRVTVPTLVIGGGQDRLVDPRVATQVAGVIPDARLLMLPDVGHVAQFEVPEITARAVLALLDEVGVAAPSAS
jgi:pimeloyl-ACP methyl ester carboxylesterase